MSTDYININTNQVKRITVHLLYASGIKRRLRKNAIFSWICTFAVLLTLLPEVTCEDGSSTSNKQNEDDIRMLNIVVYIALSVIVVCAIILCSSMFFVWHLYRKRQKELPFYKSKMDIPKEVVNFEDEEGNVRELSPRSSLGPSVIIPAGSEMVSVDGGNSKVKTIYLQPSTDDEDNLSYNYSLEPPKTICGLNTESY